MSGDDFHAFVAELLAPLGPVRVRRMFGGAGVYHGDVMFALIANRELYLKADGRSRAQFEAEGEGPFVYRTAKGERAVMSYWRAPARLLDEPEELRRWAQAAVEAALAAARTKPTRSRAKERRPRP